MKAFSLLSIAAVMMAILLSREANAQTASITYDTSKATCSCPCNAPWTDSQTKTKYNVCYQWRVANVAGTVQCTGTFADAATGWNITLDAPQLKVGTTWFDAPNAKCTLDANNNISCSGKFSYAQGQWDWLYNDASRLRVKTTCTSKTTGKVYQGIPETPLTCTKPALK